jgi:hypothetical protein
MIPSANTSCLVRSGCLAFADFLPDVPADFARALDCVPVDEVFFF